MKHYTVHAPPLSKGNVANDPVSFLFVKEGFCWPALFVPVLWLLFRRLWIVLLIYLIVAIGFVVVSQSFEGPAIMVIGLAFALLFALEANELRRWTLRRSGWRFLGVAKGRKKPDAERSFFAGWLDNAFETPAARMGPVPAPIKAEDVIGVFPTPGAPR